MRLPFWILSGRSFIWYRKVRECRNYTNARWVHYLTIFNRTMRWETE